MKRFALVIATLFASHGAIAADVALSCSGEVSDGGKAKAPVPSINVEISFDTQLISVDGDGVGVFVAKLTKVDATSIEFESSRYSGSIDRTSGQLYFRSIAGKMVFLLNCAVRKNLF